MKNVTITLDEEVLRWTRIRAAEGDTSVSRLVGELLRAEGDTSVSRLVGELLREKMRDESNYQTSMQNYLAQSPLVLKKKGDDYPDREELHDRKGLR